MQIKYIKESQEHELSFTKKELLDYLFTIPEKAELVIICKGYYDTQFVDYFGNVDKQGRFILSKTESYP